MKEPDTWKAVDSEIGCLSVLGFLCLFALAIYGAISIVEDTRREFWPDIKQRIHNSTKPIEKESDNNPRLKLIVTDGRTMATKFSSGK